MSNPKPLFIMGSKCSGSTHLVNALNLHPQVYVTHESDIVWILYQIYKDAPERFRSYPLDEDKGMWATLKKYSGILESVPAGTNDYKRIVQAFYDVLLQINEIGRDGWDDPQGKKNLAWTGDKKPVQYSDPEIQSFLNSAFPEARYIHLIRNPRFVVASMVDAAKNWGDQSVPAYWKETSQKVLESWASHEEWVLRIKSRIPNSVHTVRLEDLSDDPVRTMSEAFGFLDLDFPSGTEKLVAKWTWKNPNRRHESFDLSISPRAHRIMQTYGYVGQS
jgi:Sulfotransferase family